MGIENGGNLNQVEEAKELAEGSGVGQEVTQEQMEGSGLEEPVSVYKLLESAINSVVSSTEEVHKSGGFLNRIQQIKDKIKNLVDGVCQEILDYEIDGIIREATFMLKEAEVEYGIPSKYYSKKINQKDIEEYSHKEIEEGILDFSSDNLKNVIKNLSEEEVRRHPQLIETARNNLRSILSDILSHQNDSYTISNNLKYIEQYKDFFQSQSVIYDELWRYPEIAQLQRDIFLNYIKDNERPEFIRDSSSSNPEENIQRVIQILNINTEQAKQLSIEILKEESRVLEGRINNQYYKGNNIDKYIITAVDLNQDDLSEIALLRFKAAALTTGASYYGQENKDITESLREDLNLSDEDIKIFIERNKEELKDILYTASITSPMTSQMWGGLDYSYIVNKFIEKYNSQFPELKFTIDELKLKYTKSSELQEVVKSQIIKDVRSKFYDNVLHATQLKDFYSVSEDIIQSAEVQSAAKEGITLSLHDGYISSAKKIIKEFNVSHELIQSAAREGLILNLHDGYISSAKKIIEEFTKFGVSMDSLKSDKRVQEAARSGIISNLLNRYIDEAKETLEYFELVEMGYKKRFLEENKEELNRGLLRLLENKDIKSFTEILEYFELEETGYKNRFLEKFNVSDKQVQEAARSVIINSLYLGNIDEAKEILEYFEGEDTGYRKRFLEENKEELNRVLLRLLGNKDIKSFKEILEYFEGEDTGYRKRFLEENKEVFNNSILLRLLENKDIKSFKEILEYFEGEDTGYRKRFLEENKEELNSIIVKSFETEGIKVYKYLKELEGQEKIKFISGETNFLAEIIKQNQGLEQALIAGYFNCKAEGIIKESNYEDILDLVDRLPILSITIVKEYLEAKSKQRETEYLDKIIEIADKMISGGITEEEKSKEYFQDLLEYIYPNNIGDYANYESTSTCQDRSQDLEVFNIQEKYPIDILDRGKLELREGRELDKSSLENIQKEREDIMKVYSEGGIENIKQNLDSIIEEMISKMEEENTLGIERDKLMNQEEKIYAIMLYSRLNKGIKAEDIKKSILYYNFAYLDNIERYQTYTDEGIEKRYEQIMELSEFYKNTIQEAQNIIIEKGKNNPIFEGVKENIYIENQKRERREDLGRLQVDKLGLNDKFIKDMRNILIKRRLRKDTTKEEKIELEKKYSLDRVREIISRYESMTGFLEEKASNSPDSNTKTFYGRLKGQRNKTIEAFKTLTGEEQDLLTTHLGNINLKEVIDLKISASNGIYDEELFDRLIQQSISNLYQEEYAILETEANKFILVDYDENGKKIEKKPKKLNAYISKDALSAYARMVGGVCVAGCNPDKGSENIWDMPNYFQLVLQNPENKRCVGLVLLHHFEDENGQKILSASYNPSSTYLFSVDEGTLFNELNNTLIKFAEENNFDKIVISKNGGIRTNRTDTIFETSMNKAIAQYKDNNNGDGTYSFSEDEDFSYYTTNYQLKDMDIVWSR